MNSVLLTTRGNQFIRVLLTAYLRAGGVPFSLILFLPDRADIGYPAWAKPLVGHRLLGVAGLLKMLRVRLGNFALTSAERDMGLGCSWEHILPQVCAKCIEAPSVKKKVYLPILEKQDMDILVSCGSPIIFKKEILELPSIGALNIHNGRVPMYRGHFATFWEVLNDEKYGYVSIHEMLEKVDTGRVVVSEKQLISDSKSFLDLLIAKKQMGGKTLAGLLAEIEASGGKIPDRDLALPEDKINGMYFGWPTLSEIRKFKWNY